MLIRQKSLQKDKGENNKGVKKSEGEQCFPKVVKIIISEPDDFPPQLLNLPTLNKTRWKKKAQQSSF